MKKLITICVPCRNEVDNVQPLAKELITVLEKNKKYRFEIIYIDNFSDDGTQEKLRELCKEDKRIKAILNAKNFPVGSGLHVLYQASGDCVISIPADFQVPLAVIPEMIEEWGKGASVVALIKKAEKRDRLRFIRKLYYAMSKKLSDNDTLPGFTGSGLYDRKFLELCKSCNDSLLSIRNMVVKYASPLVKLNYVEQVRRSGKSNQSATSLIDTALKRFVLISNVAPQYAIVTGLLVGLGSLGISLYYLIRKLIDWANFPVGIAPLIIGMFFLGSVQLIFLGLMGQYIMNIHERQKNQPLVVEKERLNFDTEDVGEQEQIEKIKRIEKIEQIE